MEADRRHHFLLGVLLLAAPNFAAAADVCAPTDVQGPYGFQLAGMSRISGAPVPIASIGRLVFDGKGNISGVSSVNFKGLFLGNPVTGTYELKTDCTLNWKLQNDSGGWQNFSGRVSPGGERVEFRQTDPGAQTPGVMEKMPADCGTPAVQGRYRFSMIGRSTPFASEEGPSRVSVEAVADADGAGRLLISRGDAKTGGSYSIDSDCFVTLEFGLTEGDSATLDQLRGVLVNKGSEILAVQTDPEQVAVVKFVR